MANKKSFSNAYSLDEDPALSFISQESVRQAGTPPQPRTEGAEIKSRRVQLVMPPSLYAKVKQKSRQKGLSVNEFCRQALEKAVER